MGQTIRVAPRLSGAALVTAGALFGGTVPFHPNVLGDRSMAEVVVQTGGWQLIHVAVFFACILGIFGFAGIVAIHGGRLGRSGEVALAASIVGFVAAAAVMFLEAVVFPAVARQAPELLDIDGVVLGSALFRGLAVLAAGFPVGLVALGLGAYRIGPHRRAGLALVAASLGYFLVGFWFVPVIGPLTTVAFGAAIAWWGWIVAQASTAPAATGRRRWSSPDVRAAADPL